MSRKSPDQAKTKAPVVTNLLKYGSHNRIKVKKTARSMKLDVQEGKGQSVFHTVCCTNVLFGLFTKTVRVFKARPKVLVADFQCFVFTNVRMY